MSIPKLLLYVLWTLPAIFVGILDAQTGCGGDKLRQMCDASGFCFNGWPKGSSTQPTTIRVYIDPTQFPDATQRDQLKSAFNNWTSADGVGGNGTFVKFEVSATPVSGNNTMTVGRGTPTDGGSAQTSVAADPVNGRTLYANTIIDPRVTNLTRLAQDMAHEIGHTFGLDECYTCGLTESVMVPGSANFSDTSRGATGPTGCDNSKVADIYTPPPPPPEPTSCPEDNGCLEYFAGYNPDFCQYRSGCPEGYLLRSGCCLLNPSPIVVDVDGHGFDLSSAQDGVWFDFYGIGVPEKISWTAAGSSNAWLVLDRDGNGTIDSAKEMFGNITEQPKSPIPNGFLALAEFDKLENGGNDDGVIDQRDGVFARLRLWIDRNHNGISEPEELFALPALNVYSMELKYHESRWTDPEGNQFRYRAKIDSAAHGATGRWAYDVFLLTTPAHIASWDKLLDMKISGAFGPSHGRCAQSQRVGEIRSN